MDLPGVRNASWTILDDSRGILMSMGKITDIIPRPVYVKLGDEDFQSGELRLCDIADLQQLIDDQAGDPLGAIRERMESEGVESVELELADIMEAADRGPKVYGEFKPTMAESLQLRYMFVKVCLHRYQPDINYFRARAICGTLKPGQFGNLERIAWKVGPLEEINRILGAKLRPSRGGSTGWPKAIVQVAKEYKISLECVYGMTLSEFWFARSEGADKQDGDEFDAIAEAPRRKAWWKNIEAKRAERKGRV